MQFERAREIFFSPVTVKVMYKNIPVWITNLRTRNHHVQIKDLLSNGNELLDVPASELTEGGFIQ